MFTVSGKRKVESGKKRKKTHRESEKVRKGERGRDWFSEFKAFSGSVIQRFGAGDGERTSWTIENWEGAARSALECCVIHSFAAGLVIKPPSCYNT